MNLAVSPSSAVVIFALLAVPLMTALRVLLLRELWIERRGRQDRPEPAEGGAEIS
jgi:hypothetical protein